MLRPPTSINSVYSAQTLPTTSLRKQEFVSLDSLLTADAFHQLSLPQNAKVRNHLEKGFSLGHITADQIKSIDLSYINRLSDVLGLESSPHLQKLVQGDNQYKLLRFSSATLWFFNFYAGKDVNTQLGTEEGPLTFEHFQKLDEIFRKTGWTASALVGVIGESDSFVKYQLHQVDAHINRALTLISARGALNFSTVKDKDGQHKCHNTETRDAIVNSVSGYYDPKTATIIFANAFHYGYPDGELQDMLQTGLSKRTPPMSIEAFCEKNQIAEDLAEQGVKLSVSEEGEITMTKLPVRAKVGTRLVQETIYNSPVPITPELGALISEYSI